MKNKSLHNYLVWDLCMVGYVVSIPVDRACLQGISYNGGVMARNPSKQQRWWWPRLLLDYNPCLFVLGQAAWCGASYLSWIIFCSRKINISPHKKKHTNKITHSNTPTQTGQWRETGQWRNANRAKRCRAGQGMWERGHRTRGEHRARTALRIHSATCKHRKPFTRAHPTQGVTTCKRVRPKWYHRWPQCLHSLHNALCIFEWIHIPLMMLRLDSPTSLV